MLLTHTKIQNTKTALRPIRLFDGRGLYLEIGPAGSRWSRFKYRFGGKEKRISLGDIPTSASSRRVTGVRRHAQAGCRRRRSQRIS